MYVAQTEVTAYAISKRFLQTKIFKKYPEIASEIKEQSFYRYKKNIKSKLLKYRAEHIEEINRRSTYKVINIKERDDNAELDSEL